MSKCAAHKLSLTLNKLEIECFRKVIENECRRWIQIIGEAASSGPDLIHFENCEKDFIRLDALLNLLDQHAKIVSGLAEIFFTEKHTELLIEAVDHELALHTLEPEEFHIVSQMARLIKDLATQEFGPEILESAHRNKAIWSSESRKNSP